MLKIVNLTVRYPEVIAVASVSLQLKNGIIYGLVGPNGAGKSSLIKVLVGLISTYEGTIYYDDLILSENRHAAKHLFGYAPEDPNLYPYLTGREYLHMLAEIRKCDSTQHISTLIDDFVLEEVIDELINRYSHGMRQKLSFAAALIGKPQYLILDEALNGFDPISLFNAKRILKEFAEKGHLILLSSHVLELVENWCQEIIILNKGKLLSKYTQKKIEAIKKKTGKDFSDHFVNLVRED
jgi:ABC-2 type transport system ATP-binding protein